MWFKGLLSLLMYGQVADIDDDISFERDRAHRMKKLLLEEQGRVEYLRGEHQRIRELLAPYHDGKGWQTEAFIGQTCMFCAHTP